MMSVVKEARKHWAIYLLALAVAAYFTVFCYAPMYGLLIAFKRYSPKKGILGSEWIGLMHFKDFFTSPYFVRVTANTFLMSFFNLLWGFPAPIILALMLNEVRSSWFKRTIQTATYLPFFVSAVVIAGIIRNFTATDGVINSIVTHFGGKAANMLGVPELFRTIMVTTNIWTGIGWGSILYLSALTSIDQELYSAAEIDGAGRLRKIWHVSLPGIMNTVVVMLIFACGSLLSVNSEKVLLLYSPGIYQTADVIGTYTYRRGLIDGNFSFSTAVGLFNQVVNFILLAATNFIARRYSDYSLW